MIKKFFVLILCIILCVPIVLGTRIQIIQSENTHKESLSRLLQGGWIEERKGITILHVSGSNYEMGFQHGYLLKEKVQENLRAFLSFAQTAISREELLAYWNSSVPTFLMNTSRNYKVLLKVQTLPSMRLLNQSWQ